MSGCDTALVWRKNTRHCDRSHILPICSWSKRCDALFWSFTSHTLLQANKMCADQVHYEQYVHSTHNSWHRTDRYLVWIRATLFLWIHIKCTQCIWGNLFVTCKEYSDFLCGGVVGSVAHHVPLFFALVCLWVSHTVYDLFARRMSNEHYG